MATAKKLPSGNWRCLVYDYTDEHGKRHYKSFTSPDPSAKGKREAEKMAADYAAEKESTSRCSLTFGAALNKYIADREAVLSASTVREYKRVKRADLSVFENVKIADITPEHIQEFINQKSKEKAPKTVKNIHGIISTVLKTYRPEMALNTTLPQKVPPKLYIPSDEDIQTLLNCIDNEDMMIAVLLAAFGPLRRSEICGLEDTDFNGNIAHIQRAVVLNENKEWVDKTTKSVAGNRYVPFPDFVIDKISDRKGRIVHLKPNQISDRFIDIIARSGLPHFRFHDLRHYCASIQHALGIPDAYIMQRGGWNSDTVLKQVYRHALSDKSEEMNSIANDHFSKLCNTKCNTK
ncbi:MAG: site-specific integrase [Lachnospiraceae bacterium]|nr:site-specific integrase [Lachnospiraceae bacterium]